MCKKELWKLRLLLLLVMVGFVLNANSQSKVLTGIVKDSDGLGLPGVTVLLSGKTIGTITDLEGHFVLDIGNATDAVLEFSYLGYKTEQIAVKEQREINVKLKSDAKMLDEMVVVGYGTQKRVSITGAVNSIKTGDLPQGQSSSLATSLTGRLPGTVIVQNSGVAGAKSAAISIRGGGNPLILVDGIERGFEDLDMDEVESISVLKDASATAVYGIRGGDGVIIVTTKRGSEGAFKVNLKTEFGLMQKGQAPEMLDSYEYATLRNEGYRNNNGLPWNTPAVGDPFTEADVELFKNGLAPLTHPSHDWMDYLTNDFGHRERYTLTLSGGNKFFRSFVSLGYMNERDVYKDFDVDYNDNSSYQRYNVRANLDMDVSKTTVLSVDFGGQFSNRHQPDVSFSDLTNNMLKSTPYNSTFYDGKVISPSFADVSDNPLSILYDSGYKDSYSNKLQFAAKVDQSLDFITRGLDFNASISYDHNFANSYTASKSATKYILGFVDPATGVVTEARGQTIDPTNGNMLNPYTNQYVSQYDLGILQTAPESKLSPSRSTSTGERVINFRATLRYKRAFGQHNVAALAVFTTNSRSFHSGSEKYVPFRYLEGAARVSYNYGHRYFIEFNGGYNGSETFAPENRFGFFPAISAGWVLTNEPYMPKNKVLTFLKLRGSYGTTGIDGGANRFMYYDDWTLAYTGGYKFGSTPGGLGTAYQNTVGNPLVMWATNFKTNIAIETAWAGDRLSIDADVFRNDKKGVMMQPNVVPSIVASPLPAENMKEVRYEGYELQFKWKDHIGDWGYNVFANFNYANAENIFIDELTPEYDWQRKTGRHPNQLEALDCIGFYTQEDIDAIASNGGVGTPDIPTTTFGVAPLQAGDLKYRDLNEDGLIDNNDMRLFENTSTPKTSFGFGGGFSWKNLSVNLFFQGVSDVTYLLSGAMRRPFESGRTNGAAYIMNRWTPDRADSGEDIYFPRMTDVGVETDHNFKDSSFWMHDASYIRLKNASISYKIKTRGLKKAGIEGIGLNLSGTNLLTFTNLKFVDPETKSGSNIPIPPNRVYTLGLNISF